MKRATLLLDDALYNKAKALSQRRGVTLKDVINDLLRTALNYLPATKTSPVKLPLHKGNGPKTGVEISDRNALYDLLDEDHKFKKLYGHGS